MKRFLSPFAVAAMIGVLALVALLVYGLAQNSPDRGIEDALQRGEGPSRRPPITASNLSGGGHARRSPTTAARWWC